VRRDGRVLLDRAIGHARGNGPADRAGGEQVAVTTDTPFNIYSASKAVTAMVIHLLDQRHRLHLDDAVSHYIPEYSSHGKDRITVRQVLTHRAGVPNLPRGAIDLDRLGDTDWVLGFLCDAKPLWRPGRLIGYHAISGGFILGEVVRRITGKTIRDVLREEILEPLRFRWGNYGVAREDVDKVALAYVTGPPALPPLSTMIERALGVTIREAVDFSNDPRFLTAIVPAGNVVTTANELSRFYQLLLDGGELDGVRVFDPRTIRRATAEQSYLEFDLTLGFPLRYGMGFMLGAQWLSLYGPDTEQAFGHLGFTNVSGWADPERGVAAGLMTSGKPLLYPQLYHLFDIARQIGAACPKRRS
jgi:CubicO group peptidase (beta-lactamase class C family)